MFLDIGLPGIDGYETCRRLRARGSRAVVAALTGWGQDDDRRRTASAGFAQHLVKPVSPETVLALVARRRASIAAESHGARRASILPLEGVPGAAARARCHPRARRHLAGRAFTSGHGRGREDGMKYGLAWLLGVPGSIVVLWFVANQMGCGL